MPAAWSELTTGSPIATVAASIVYSPASSPFGYPASARSFLAPARSYRGGGGAQKKAKVLGMIEFVSNECPSVSAWLIACRSIARLAARRTRRSCHGDFGSHWSTKATHCITLDTTGLSVSPGVRRRSSPSDAVIQYVTSISPFLSAAYRVVGSGMTRRTRRFTLGVLRQYPSTASMTSSTPGVNETNR